MKKYNLCIVHQKEEKQIFEDVVFSMAHGLAERGHEVNTSVNSLDKDATNIIFGAHVSPASIKPQLHPNSIIYNTEQHGSIWMTDAYLDLLKDFKVWDYSQVNAKKVSDLLGGKPVSYNPVGYAPGLERIFQLSESSKDIDVLLYGSICQRRQDIMTALHERGLKTMYVMGAYGNERDLLIGRSKIVINIHYYPSAIMETIRLSYLLNNKCFVITEKPGDWKSCPEYWYTMVMSDYNWLVEDVMEYIKAPERRQNVAECGYQLFKEFKQEEVLSEEV